MCAKKNGAIPNARVSPEELLKKEPRIKSKIGINGNMAKKAVLTVDDHSERDLLYVLTEVKNGNFTVRLPIDQTGLKGKIYDTMNDIISLNEKMMLEFTRAGNTIGKQGKLTQRIE